MIRSCHSYSKIKIGRSKQSTASRGRNRKAFTGLLHTLYYEFEKSRKLNRKGYQTLKAKLDNVHMAMHRIRKGENQAIKLY